MRSSVPAANEMGTLGGFARVSAYAFAGALVLLGGCHQGEGERCEVDSDCAGDLYCAPTPSPHNGVCRPKASVGSGGSTGQTNIPSAPVDARVEPDVPADAGSDHAVPTTEAGADTAGNGS
jgi:hypothetical protein